MKSNLIFSDKFKVYAGYLLVILISIYMWSPLVNAQWGLVDDHEVVWLIGESNRLNLFDIPSVLMKTELNLESSLPRFRPSYYTVRAIEASVFGKNPSLWYLLRVLIFVYFGCVLFGFLFRIESNFIPHVFIVYCLSASYWSDIFARAGPAEVYCVLGVALMMHGLLHIYAKHVWKLSYWMVFVGFLLAVGAKENMIFLAAIPLWLLFTKKMSLLARVLMVSMLLYTALIVVILIGRLSSIGADIYANDIGLQSRFLLMKSLVKSSGFKWLFLLSLSSSIYYVVLKRVGGVSELIVERAFVLVVAIVLCAFIYASQFVFYAGKWPDGAMSRYLFPGFIFLHLGAFFAISILFLYFNEGQFFKYVKNVFLFILCIYYASPVWTSMNENRQFALNTSKITSKFNVEYNKARIELAQDVTKVLVVQVGSIWDCEPVQGLVRFLRSDRLANPVVVIVGPTVDAVNNGPLEISLRNTLHNWEKDGATFGLSSRSILINSNCYSIGLSGDAYSGCIKSGGKVW